MSRASYTHRKIYIRGINYSLYHWGKESSPFLFLLHGWMDCAASFEPLITYLSPHFRVISLDWRGFGNSSHNSSNYYFTDYLADLDAIIHQYSPTEPVYLAGHSLGGNLALHYAGLRNNKVRKIISLEGIGLPNTNPKDSVTQTRKWLTQELNNEPEKIYPTIKNFKQSIQKANPTLNETAIDTLSQLWGNPIGNGQWQLKHDHKHRITMPSRYLYDDAKAIWAEITAPVSLIMASNTWLKKMIDVDKRVIDLQQTCDISKNHIYWIKDSDHMLHIEQPQATSTSMLDFLL